MSENKTKLQIGVGVCGSFCTLKKALKAFETLVKLGYDIVPVLSFNVLNLDTRFFKAEEFRAEIEQVTSNKCLTTIVGAEPIGTGGIHLDAFVVAPCTGNTLAKIAHGITDTPVTMAVKATLRNNRPVVLALASNDSLGANGKNLGLLMNTKHVYFVPFSQDAPSNKTNSVIASFELLPQTLEYALQGKQIEPVLLQSAGL